MEILESICDGVCDSLLAAVYEERFHPPEKIYQPWIDKQWEKVRGAEEVAQLRVAAIGYGDSDSVEGIVARYRRRIRGEPGEFTKLGQRIEGMSFYRVRVPFPILGSD